MISTNGFSAFQLSLCKFSTHLYRKVNLKIISISNPLPLVNCWQFRRSQVQCCAKIVHTNNNHYNMKLYSCDILANISVIYHTYKRMHYKGNFKEIISTSLRYLAEMLFLQNIIVAISRRALDEFNMISYLRIISP